MNKIFDVIIIGAGPAGISAAIQLKRYDVDLLLIEKNGIGGLLKNASLIENFPGFPDGISVVDLIKLFKKHSTLKDINLKKENVLTVNFKNKIYEVETDSRKYFSKNLVIASGTKPIQPGIPISGKVKTYYEVSELFKVRGKDIAIVGGGDAAFDYAYSLIKNNNRVFIIHRGKKPRCIPALLKKVLHYKNISYFCNLKIGNITKLKNKIVIDCTNGKMLDTDYLLMATGREPELGFMKKEMLTKINKLKDDTLFLIGDVKNEIYRQATISIGDGIRAGMMISEKLRNENESKS